MLFRGSLAGTEIALVVEVYAICDGIESPTSAEFFHGGE